MVLFIGASTFENDIAWKSIFNCEAELRLVEDIFLGSKVDLDGTRQVLFLKLILGDRWSDEALRDLAQWL